MAVRALGFLLPPMCPRQGTLQKTDCRTSKKSLPPPPSQGPGKGQTNNRKYFWQYLSPSSQSLMEKPCSTFSRPNEKLKVPASPCSPPYPSHTEAVSLIHPPAINQEIGQAGWSSILHQGKPRGALTPLLGNCQWAEREADLRFPSVARSPQLLECPQWSSICKAEQKAEPPPLPSSNEMY